MVQNFTDYTAYPVPQDRGPVTGSATNAAPSGSNAAPSSSNTGPVEPQLDGPSEGEMDAPAKLIVADAGEAVNTKIAWPPPPGKRAYMDRIAPAVLVTNADNLIGELAEARVDAMMVRGRLRATQEAMSGHEATLIASDAYAAGKNAEIRSAWLRGQRLIDPAFAALVAAEYDLQARLAEAEATLETLGRQYDLAKLEIRLAIASLHFMAGGE